MLPYFLQCSHIYYNTQYFFSSLKWEIFQGAPILWAKAWAEDSVQYKGCNSNYFLITC